MTDNQQTIRQQQQQILQENNNLNEEEQKDIEILKQKLRNSKEPQINSLEQEVNQYISLLKNSSQQNIQSIISGHKDRLFQSELQVDPQNKIVQQASSFYESRKLRQQQQDSESDIILQNTTLKSTTEQQETQQQQEELQGTNAAGETIKSAASQKKAKERGAIWRAQNRDHADYESSFKDYLQQKADDLLNPKKQKILHKYKPIILKTDEKTQYDKGVDDSEIMSEYSALSDFAYETAADIMKAYKTVFESQGKKEVLKAKRIKDFKDDEIYLLSQFYDKIRRKSSQDDCISKEEFEKSLLSNPFIMEMYNISPGELHKLVEEFITQKQNLFSRQEMIEFLIAPTRVSLKTFDYKHAEALLQNRPKPSIKKEFILEEKDLQTITEVFLHLDTFGDHRVSVKQLVHTIRRDPRTKQLLPKPIVYIKEVRKSIPVDRLIFELEQEMYFAPTEELRKQHSYITWDEFIDFLYNYKRKVIPTKDEVIKAQRLTGKFQSGDVIELPKEFIKVLKEVFDTCDKIADDYVRKYQYGEELRHHNQFKEYARQLVREQEYNGQRVENVSQTLDRFIHEADEFVDLDEVIDFYTRKGRPMVIEKQFQEKIQRDMRERAMNQWNREEFSSPDEDELKEKRVNRKKNKIQGMKQKRQVSIQEDEKKKQEERIKGKKFGAIHKDNEEGFNITVPQPFAFDKREKKRKEYIVERRLKESLQEKQDEEDRICKIPGTFRANKIPKHVKDKNLYSKICKQQEKRREEVREHSKAITRLNENPFTFYYRDMDNDKLNKLKQRYAEEEALKFEHFKAKPAPWYTSVLMLERMYAEQAEKSRKYVAKRMEELAKMSNLPQGVKSMMERLKKKDEEMKERQNSLPLEFTFQPPKANPIPDFDLLHQEFQQRLDEKKSQAQLTQTQEFNFQETRKAPKREYLDKENQLMKQTKEVPETWKSRDQKIQKLKDIAPKYLPPSTKKFEAMVERRKQIEEIKQMEKEEIEQRDQDKEIRRQQFAKFVRSSKAIIDNKEQMESNKQHLLKQRKFEQIEWEQQFDHLIANMMERVIRRPLLVESQSQGNYGQDRDNRLKWLLGDGRSIEEQQEGYDQEQPQFETQEEYEAYQQQLQQQQIQQQIQQQGYQQQYQDLEQLQEHQYEDDDEAYYQQQEQQQQMMAQQQMEEQEYGVIDNQKAQQQYDQNNDQGEEQYYEQQEYQDNDNQQQNYDNEGQQEYQQDDNQLEQQQQFEQQQQQYQEQEDYQDQQQQNDDQQQQLYDENQYQEQQFEQQQEQYQDEGLIDQNELMMGNQQLMEGEPMDDNDNVQQRDQEEEEDNEGDITGGYQQQSIPPQDQEDFEKSSSQQQQQQDSDQQEQYNQEDDNVHDMEMQEQEQQQQYEHEGEQDEDDQEFDMEEGELNIEDYPPEQRLQIIQMLREQGYDIPEEDVEQLLMAGQYQEGDEEQEHEEDDDDQQNHYEGGYQPDQRQHSF